jgi:signal transduction histidine kinase
VKRNKDSETNNGHDKSIRKRLTRTALFPNIALIVMWAAVSAYFVGNAAYVGLVMDGVKQVSIPAVTALASAQKERQLSVAYLDKLDNGLSALQAQQQQTDQILTGLQDPMKSSIAMAPASIKPSLTALSSDIAGLPAIRAQVMSRTISKAQVTDYYNRLLDTAWTVFDTQAHVVPEVVTSQGGSAAAAVFRATDQLSRETSLVSSAFATQTFSPDDYLLFTQLAGSYQSALQQTAPFLHPAVQDRYQRLVSSDAWKRLVADEAAIIKRGPATASGRVTLPISEAEWQSTTNEVFTNLVDLTVADANAVAGQSLDTSNANLTITIVGSVIALLIAVGSIFFAMRVSRTLVDRTLVTRLERLKNDALELASKRLPSIVQRLKAGEPVDVNAELPKLDHGEDEIGKVAEAFNIAQGAAVSAAASEAQARSGLTNVFLGIAHRNQNLIYSQLQVLDRMERNEDNPTQLAELYDLDHLATRARRTTENLITLGGKQPGRRWRNPVRLIEVVRAAVSETKEYRRVEVEQVPEVAIIGSAVADTIHLIAELVDNATSFSPPGFQVHVTSTLVARGVLVDVSDAGLGMKDDLREWANEMMTKKPEFDAMALKADATLGLFVVAQLSTRLGMTVSFDTSRYGGTRATVLIPTDILASEGQFDAEADSDFQPTSKANHSKESPGGVEVGAGLTMNGVGLGNHSGTITKQSSKPTEPVMTADTSTSSNGAQSPLWPGEQHPGAAPRPQAGSASPPRHRRPRPWPGEQHPGAAPQPQAETATPPRRRPPLPQRTPQESIVQQLRDDPELDDGAADEFIERPSSFLAFQRGVERAEGVNMSADIAREVGSPE